MVSGRDVCCVCVLTRENLFARRRASMGGKWEANAVDITNFWHSTMQTARQRLEGSEKKHNEKAMTKTYERARGKVQTSHFFSLAETFAIFQMKTCKFTRIWWLGKKQQRNVCYPARELSKHTTHESWMTLAFFFFCFSIIRLITVACEREKWNMRVKHKLKGAELSASAQLLRCTVYTSELWLN